MRTFSQYVTFIGMGVFVVLMLLSFNAAGSSPDDGFGFGWAFFGMLFLVILVPGTRLCRIQCMDGPPSRVEEP